MISTGEVHCIDRIAGCHWILCADLRLLTTNLFSASALLCYGIVNHWHRRMAFRAVSKRTQIPGSTHPPLCATVQNGDRPLGVDTCTFLGCFPSEPTHCPMIQDDSLYSISQLLFHCVTVCRLTTEKK